MFKKTMQLILTGMLVLNFSGCFLVAAGVGGAGTAAWLSGKLTQEFHASYHRTIDAAKSAMQSLNFPIVSETSDETTTQIKGTYSDGREIWVDIHRIDEHSTKVEVRVGGVNPDKDADALILKRIQDSL